MEGQHFPIHFFHYCYICLSGGLVSEAFHNYFNGKHYLKERFSLYDKIEKHASLGQMYICTLYYVLVLKSLNMDHLPILHIFFSTLMHCGGLMLLFTIILMAKIIWEKDFPFMIKSVYILWIFSASIWDKYSTTMY